MVNIATAVKQILSYDAAAKESLAKGFMNLTAYATSIKSEVESLTKKNVKIGAIVVALSRIEQVKTLYQDSNLGKMIVEITSKSPLCEIVYKKDEEKIKTAIALYSNRNNSEDNFFAIALGTKDIVIIANQNFQEKILKKFSIKPTFLETDLVGISIRFTKNFIITQGIIYRLVGSISANNINIVEIVSAYCELSFIIHRSDLQIAFDTLNHSFSNRSWQSTQL